VPASGPPSLDVPEVEVAPDPAVEPEETRAVPLPSPEVSPLVVPTALPDVVPLDAASVPDDRPALVPDPLTICVDPLCACAPVDEPEVADAGPLGLDPHAAAATSKQGMPSVASIRI